MWIKKTFSRKFANIALVALYSIITLPIDPLFFLLLSSLLLFLIIYLFLGFQLWTCLLKLDKYIYLQSQKKVLLHPLFEKDLSPSVHSIYPTKHERIYQIKVQTPQYKIYLYLLLHFFSAYCFMVPKKKKKGIQWPLDKAETLS